VDKNNNSGKNIIVLSDGTGNGAAKVQKTNVWRLYRALKLHDQQQLAFYDDGVGSGNSRISKILGGVFGFGLKRNVLDMYLFLCRSYRPADEEYTGDRIYLFGFSRGAFTIRMLASFIQIAGLIDDPSLTEDQLRKKAAANYSDYRRQYRCGLIYRGLMRVFFPRPECQTDHRPSINFLGVWDTVDAYALPMDELAMIWHWLVYPIRFTNYDLSDGVIKARHVISIDDERHTFHPLLWNEPASPSTDSKQVWFSGVHANVGGGYPDDSLALVSLDWMMSECQGETADQGLVFIDELRRQYHDQSDWNGPLYNSRSGLGVYYRYKPRDIEELCQPPDINLRIPQAIIHRSVFERIASAGYPYAPTGLPAQYSLDGEGRRSDYETKEERTSRAISLEAAKNNVFMRRILYSLFLATSLLLVASRFFLPWRIEVECTGSTCAVAPLLQWLPDVLAPWIKALLQNGYWLVGFITVYLVLLVVSRRLRLTMLTLARRAWSPLNRLKSEPDFNPGKLGGFRKLWASKIGFRVGRIMAIFIFLLMLYLLAWIASAASFHIRSTTGGICRESDSSIRAPNATGVQIVELSVDNSCMATGLKLKKGITYRLVPSTTGLLDGTQCATTVNGLSNTSLPQDFFALFKRHRSQPYIKLMGRIGNSGDEAFPIDAIGTDYTPKSGGRLYLYVNDAVVGFLPNWDYFYGSTYGLNRGIVELKVSPSPTIPLPKATAVIQAQDCEND
jgi:uncharacterized protein (DUF2235 family)